jgi:hypothetical protein
MARHRSESPYSALAQALRDAAYILDQFTEYGGPLGVFLTDKTSAESQGVVHFYPRTPREWSAVKRSVQQAADPNDMVQVEWSTEKLIAPAQTATFGKYLELSIEKKGDLK